MGPWLFASLFRVVAARRMLLPSSFLLHALLISHCLCAGHVL